MMKRYNICIKETLERCVEVNANDSEEAYRKVKNLYRNEDIVLTADDYKNTEFIFQTDIGN